MAAEIAGFRTLQTVMAWMERRGIALGSVEIVFQDEYSHDFLVPLDAAGRHLAFGIGVHFCMGSRLAEMQLRVLWEETLARFRVVEVVEPPRRVRSNFVKGYASLPVQVHRW